MEGEHAPDKAIETDPVEEAGSPAANFVPIVSTADPVPLDGVTVSQG